MIVTSEVIAAFCSHEVTHQAEYSKPLDNVEECPKNDLFSDFQQNGSGK
jgi:hypothetical protein